MPDNLQKQRFEFKYHLESHTALAVRDFVSSYLELDAFGATQPNYSYPVHSLYLDSPNLKTYYDTINGERNRYKLRIRYYESGGDRPVYFEMKRRINSIIAKKRAKVYRSSAERLVSGFMPGWHDLAVKDDDGMDAILDISQKINYLQARPTVHVSYLREAWMADGTNKIRVTFDRDVYTEPVQEVVFKNEMYRPTRVFGNTVILELKFTDRFPEWFKTLVQVFGLRQQSAAKYVDGLINLGHENKIRLS
ncbi:MAG: polyphosphate polymerase domain-containing protein [Candidatus Cyclonatronum sp.]|uniref:polyphosphate polymerase domain-containing protein n=1 Tax=Cyclonatronum sp. TaxID=3024185 RepID=UPI0025BAFAB2|nr:polyphosphate polymerase domain-containing protein [Cyclonatronum sp.]MCH8487903.1 polyphosphate polymerase domain-containing protein [Cyclonatronum sp.]